MKIDWQEFEDGGLGEEAMKQAREQLSQSSSAQNELKGLAAFKRAVRSAALGQQVPDHKLNLMLKSVCGVRQRPLWQRTLGLAAAGAACVALAFILVNQLGGLPPSDESQSAFVTTGDYERDFASATKNSPIYVPHLELAGLAEYKGVHSCRANVSFKLAYQGQEFTLTITPKEAMEAKGRVINQQGVELVKSGESFCWTCPASSYRLEGGAPAQRARFAAALTKQTGYVRPQNRA